MTPARFPSTAVNLCTLAGGTSALLGLAPQLQPYLAPSLVPWALGLSSAWGLWRLWQLYQALGPYWAWRHGRLWVVDPFALPIPERSVLVGRGFRWTAAHTQLLETALLEEGALPLDTGPRGGLPCLHAVGKVQIQDLRLSWADMARHLRLTGSPGSGKTKALELLATEAIRRNEGAVVLIDPKPSYDLLARAKATAQRVGKPWALLCPAFPQVSATINVLDTATTVTEVATRILSLMPNAGQDTDPFYREYPLAMIEHVARVQAALGQPWTLEGLYRDTALRPRMDRLLLRYLKHLGVTPKDPVKQADNLKAHKAAYAASGLQDFAADDLIEDSDHDVDHFRKVTSNLIPTFRGVIGAPYGTIFSGLPADVTWDRAVREGMVVYIAIPSMLLGDLGNRIFRVICQDLIGYLGWRYALGQAQDAPPMTVLVDELRQVLYPGFNTALAMSREAQCAWILAQQSHADTELVLGPAAARVLFDNTTTAFYFQGADRQTAAEVSEGFGTATVHLPDQAHIRINYGDTGGLSGGTDNHLRAERVPAFRQEWIGGLPVGHYVAQMRGTMWKGEVPLLQETAPAPLPALAGPEPQALLTTRAKAFLSAGLLPAPREGAQADNLEEVL